MITIRGDKVDNTYGFGIIELMKLLTSSSEAPQTCHRMGQDLGTKLSAFPFCDKKIIHFPTLPTVPQLSLPYTVDSASVW